MTTTKNIQLGLRENIAQFSLLVLVNAFVGAMVGMERSILPAIAEEEFHLAARTAIRGFISGSDGAAGYRFRDEPDVTQYALPDNTYFLFLDPSAVAYQVPREEEDTSGAWSALDMIFEVLEGFVKSARASELRTIVETNPGIRERILVTRSYFPQISAPLGGFFGLFDRELTHFDFILGMYDARRLWTDDLGPAYLARHGLPPDSLAWPDPSEATGAWRELACMRGLFDSDEGLLERCEGLDRAAFLPALQTTLERLYVSCHLAGSAVPRGTRHTHCARAQHADARPPRLAALPPDSAWQQLPDEEDTDYAVRRLAANGFVFRDLGLSASQSARASLRIRQQLGLLARAFVRAQPHHRVITSTVAEVALNEFLYRPPRHILSFDVSPDIGIGYSFTNPYGRAPFLRVTLGLGIQGFTTLLSSARNEFGIAPTVGLEFEPIRLNGSLLRGRLGVRAGYGWSSVDNYGDGACDPRDQSNLRCSRFFVDAYALLTLADVVRISLGITYAPPLGRFDHGEFGFRPTIGLQWRSGR